MFLYGVCVMESVKLILDSEIWIEDVKEQVNISNRVCVFEFNIFCNLLYIFVYVVVFKFG